MSDRKLDNKTSDPLLKVLTAHYKALVSAGSDERVLRQYAALLRFLKSGNAPKFLQEPVHAKHTEMPGLFTLNDRALISVSLDQIDKFLSDERLTRKDLERIAIQRFSVPHGSMRSFSNRQLLVDKIRTLIDNERTHETIGEVARGQTKQS
ncbi:MAG: hypothetical protein CXZ00_06090 [Acidobacteria bacterium]|nr:MAG: hypothetical protein CXZ00_06090 [Acidobacteriota bacterium]